MPLETYQILLADDDEIDRLFFKDAIGELKVNAVLTMVNDGVQLMDYLNQKDVILPHLLFLDINMPRKNGMKALEEIRANEKLKDLSVAIYSTSSAKKDVEEALLKGANIYINKPNDFEQLKKILFKAIKLNWQYQTSGLNKENFILSI